MSYNVWWVGADGNVWTRQGDTVTNQGKLINDYGQNGFDAERLSAGDVGDVQWELINDPVSRTPTPTTDPSRTSAAAPAPPKVVNQAAVSATQQAIDSLGTEEQVGNQNIDQGLGSLMGRYDLEAGRANEDFNEQTVTNNQNLQRNRQNALVSAAQGRRGLRGTLAAMGALSGTGIDLADRAVTSEANQDLGGAAETAAANVGTLTKAKKRFDEEDTVRRDEARTTAENQRTALRGNIASKRQQMYQKMAEIFEEGGNTAEAGRFLGMAGGLNNEIAANTRVAATPFTAKSAAFTPGTLESYLAGAGDMTVSVGEGGTAGNLNPTSILAGRSGRRKSREEEELAVA